MAKHFSQLNKTHKNNSRTREFMKLVYYGWREASEIEVLLWEEHSRRRRGLKFVPDWAYDYARHCLDIDVGRQVGDWEDYDTFTFWRHPDYLKLRAWEHKKMLQANRA